MSPLLLRLIRRFTVTANWGLRASDHPEKTSARDRHWSSADLAVLIDEEATWLAGRPLLPAPCRDPSARGLIRAILADSAHDVGTVGADALTPRTSPTPKPRHRATRRQPMHPPEVGRTARRTRTVTAHDIELFTELTGDRNPLHYDEELATRSRFGERIVQGGVTSGLLNAVVAEDLPGPGSVFLHVDWSFTAPVRPGDDITAEVEVLESRADKPITRLRTTVTRADGVVALHGTALVWREDLERPHP